MVPLLQHMTWNRPEERTTIRKQLIEMAVSGGVDLERTEKDLKDLHASADPDQGLHPAPGGDLRSLRDHLHALEGAAAPRLDPPRSRLHPTGQRRAVPGAEAQGVPACSCPTSWSCSRPGTSR